jgi:hypothetical protein
MPTQDLREQIGDSKAGHSGLQLLPAIIYTSDCVLRGGIRSEIAGTLADILSHRANSPLSGSTDAFLHLIDVEALSPGGTKEHIQSTYVMKENILFAAQTKLERVRQGKSGVSRPHAEEWNDRILAVAYVPSHILIGWVAGDAWRTLARDLGCRQTFLSLYEVRVSSHSTEGETRYALAAVNSSRILHITQLHREGEMPAHLTVDGILSELLGLKCYGPAKSPRQNA